MGLQVGTILKGRYGRYRIVSRLGEGGMGSVYQAEDTAHPGVYWAIKELLDDTTAPPEDVEWAKMRFEAEIKLMRDEGLHHPRIPAYRDDFASDGHRFLVMEYIPGMNLEERQLRAHAPLPEREVLRWMIDICDVLTYLHRQKPPIIVRDLKPANVMIPPDNEARLIDFGIARRYKPGQRTNTENLGTMTYASPEHLGRTQTDQRSDIYSLGATMFHLLTNQEPTPLETPYPGKLRQHQPTLSPATEAAVIKAMQIDPRQRFQSAAEFRDALAHCLLLLDKSKTTVSTGGPRQQQAPARAPATVITPAVSRPAVPVRAGKPAAAGSQPIVLGLICPRCGFLNRQGARFCAQDGVALQRAGIDSSSMPYPISDQPYASASGARASAPVPGTAYSGAVGAAVTTAELSIQKANEAFRAHQYQRVVHECEMAISQGRQTYDVYLLLGRALSEQRRQQEAAAAFAEAARLRPTFEAVRLAADAWQQAGQLDQAQIAYTRARQLDPRDAETSYHLGVVCCKLGQLAQAEGELETAIKLRPNYIDAMLALGRVQAARKQWDQATLTYQKAISIDPDSAVALVELGKMQLAQNHPAEAVRSFERAAKLAPNSDDIQVALGMGLHAVGHRRAAKTALQRALQINPKNTEAQRLLKQD
jgi:serine/threonine protein kinase/tetratricopeptide (TPR) repeat protein